MAVTQLIGYDEGQHHFDVGRDEEGEVYVTVDHAVNAHGYYAAGVVRFPKGIVIDGQFLTSLKLSQAAQAVLQ